jgi:hypothetical protein
MLRHRRHRTQHGAAMVWGCRKFCASRESSSIRSRVVVGGKAEGCGGKKLAVAISWGPRCACQAAGQNFGPPFARVLAFAASGQAAERSCRFARIELAIKCVEPFALVSLRESRKYRRRDGCGEAWKWQSEARTGKPRLLKRGRGNLRHQCAPWGLLCYGVGLPRLCLV